MRFVIALPYAWLAIFFLLPFALVLAIALGTNAPDLVPPVELGLEQTHTAEPTCRAYLPSLPAQPQPTPDVGVTQPPFSALSE